MTFFVVQVIGQLMLKFFLVLWHLWSLIPYLGIILQVVQCPKKPSPHLLKPFGFLWGLLEGWNFDRTSMSLRFFGLLYAITDGLGKQRFRRGSSSIITLWCFFTMLEIGGRAGWYVVMRGVCLVLVLGTFFRASVLFTFLILWKEFSIIFGW